MDIEKVLLQVEEYEKLKGEATPKGEWEAVYDYEPNVACLRSKDKWIGINIYDDSTAQYLAYAHNWSPETIIRELVAVVGAQTEIIKAYERRDQKTKG